MTKLRSYEDGDINAIPERVDDFPRGLMGPLLAMSDTAFTLLDDEGNILMCLGVAHIWVGVADVWTAVHPDCGTSTLTLVRETRNVMNDYAAVYGVRRYNSMAFNDEQRKWMEVVGFVQEGVKHAYGPREQDVFDMVWWAGRGKRNERLQTKRQGKRRAPDELQAAG